MATTEVTPNVAPAAAPAAAAPAAAPAVSESTAAPQGGQESTQAPAAVTETRADSGFEKDSIEDRIFQTLDKKRQEREGGESAEAKPAGEQKTEEQKLAEEVKTGEEKTEEQKAAEAKAAEQQQPGFDLEVPDINQKWLDDLIAGNKVKIEDEATRSQLFNVVREHGEFKKIADKFPTVEDAEQALSHSATFLEADQVYQNAHTPEGTAAWLGKLQEMEEANPVLGPDGQPVNVVRAMFDNMREMDFRFFEKQFTEADDQQALAALSILRSRISGQKTQAGEEVEIPEEAKKVLDQREAALTAREKALNEKDQKSAVTEQQQFETAVATDLNTEINTVVTSALDKAAFSAVTRSDCENKIYQRILDSLKDNRMYKAEKARLFAKGVSEDNRRAMKAMQMKYFNSVAPGIIRRTVAEYRDPVMKAQVDKDTRQKQQEAQSRSNPAGAAATPGAPQVLTVDQQKDKVMADLSKELGRRPTTEEFLGKWLKIKSDARLART